MPGAGGSALSTLTCMYTVTPDWNFVLDRYPGTERVVFGCGFSGHGFKFASAIGEALAELVVDGKASQPIDFLQMNRLASQKLAR